MGILDIITEQQENKECLHPSLKLHCTSCGWRGTCGTAPHDIEGALCPQCGRGEKIREVA